MTTILGACSLCGGEVTIPTVWHGVIPPTPTCSRCHAVENKAVIPMQRSFSNESLHSSHLNQLGRK